MEMEQIGKEFLSNKYYKHDRDSREKTRNIGNSLVNIISNNVFFSTSVAHSIHFSLNSRICINVVCYVGAVGFTMCRFYSYEF